MAGQSRTSVHDLIYVCDTRLVIKIDLAVDWARHIGILCSMHLACISEEMDMKKEIPDPYRISEEMRWLSSNLHLILLIQRALAHRTGLRSQKPEPRARVGPDLTSPSGKLSTGQHVSRTFT